MSIARRAISKTNQNHKKNVACGGPSEKRIKTTKNIACGGQSEKQIKRFKTTKKEMSPAVGHLRNQSKPQKNRMLRAI